MAVELSNSEYTEIAQRAAYIAFHAFKWQYTTLVLFNVTYLYAITTFIKVYDKKVELFSISKDSLENIVVEDTAQYVLFLNDISDIIFTLGELKLHKFNTNSKFIIVCKEDNGNDVTKTTQLLWNYRILNVIYVKYDESDLNGYTYFTNEDCDSPAPGRLRYWEDCTYSYRDSKQVCKTDNLFPAKLNNFHRCPIVVTTFVMNPFMLLKDGIPSGIDGSLLRIMVDALNATVVITSTRDKGGWGAFVNNSWTGALGDVDKNIANFSMVSSTMTLQRYKYFDMSNTYNTLNLVWGTHPSQFKPSSFKLLRPFSIGAWFLLIITYIIFVASYYFLDRRVLLMFCGDDNENIEYTDNFIMYTLQITLGVSVTRFPKKNLKTFILLWIWYWFLVRTLYQVYLIPSLQTEVKIADINSIRDGIAAGYSLGSGEAIKDYYTDDPYILKHWNVIVNYEIQPILRNLTKGMKYLLGTNLYNIRAFEQKNHVNLHILSLPISRSYSVLYLKKHSCLTRPINVVLTRLFEGGIAERIFQHYTSVIPDIGDIPYKPLTVNHFQGCFGILILGWCLSAFIFIMEIFVKNINRYCV